VVIYRNFPGLLAALIPSVFVAALGLFGLGLTEYVVWFVGVASWFYLPVLLFFPYGVELDERTGTLSVQYVLRERTRPADSVATIQMKRGPMFRRVEIYFRRGRLVIRENDAALALVQALLNRKPEIAFDTFYPGFSVSNDIED
jgi:hypothetical protein